MKIIKFPGKRKLVVDTETGKIGSEGGPDNPEFEDRLERIRNNLDRINKLMADLRRVSDQAHMDEIDSQFQDRRKK